MDLGLKRDLAALLIPRVRLYHASVLFSWEMGQLTTLQRPTNDVQRCGRRWIGSQDRSMAGVARQQVRHSGARRPDAWVTPLQSEPQYVMLCRLQTAVI